MLFVTGELQLSLVLFFSKVSVRFRGSHFHALSQSSSLSCTGWLSSTEEETIQVLSWICKNSPLSALRDTLWLCTTYLSSSSYFSSCTLSPALQHWFPLSQLTSGWKCSQLVGCCFDFKSQWLLLYGKEKIRVGLQTSPVENLWCGGFCTIFRPLSLVLKHFGTIWWLIRTIGSYSWSTQ